MGNIWCLSRFHATIWPISRLSIINFQRPRKRDHENKVSTSRFHDWKWHFSQIHVRKMRISRSQQGLQIMISFKFSADLTFSHLKNLYFTYHERTIAPPDSTTDSPATHQWWRHDMEIRSKYLTISAFNAPMNGSFTLQRASIADNFFVVGLDKRFNKRSSFRWFEPKWRHLMQWSTWHRSSFKKAMMQLWMCQIFKYKHYDISRT